MNTLRTFILFVFVMGVVVIFQISIENNKNSLITNSEVVNEYKSKEKITIFPYKYMVYPNSKIIKEDLKTIIVSTEDDEYRIQKWYGDKFREVNMLSNKFLKDKHKRYQDNSGVDFGVRTLENGGKTAISLKL